MPWRLSTVWPSYMPTLVKDVGFYRHVLSALRQGRYVHAPFFCFLLLHSILAFLTSLSCCWNRFITPGLCALQ